MAFSESSFLGQLSIVPQAEARVAYDELRSLLTSAT
jgi:hypothetical protein